MSVLEVSGIACFSARCRYWLCEFHDWEWINLVDNHCLQIPSRPFGVWALDPVVERFALVYNNFRTAATRMIMIRLTMGILCCIVEVVHRTINSLRVNGRPSVMAGSTDQPRVADSVVQRHRGMIECWYICISCMEDVEDDRHLRLWLFRHYLYIVRCGSDDHRFWCKGNQKVVTCEAETLLTVNAAISVIVEDLEGWEMVLVFLDEIRSGRFNCPRLSSYGVE